MTNTEKILAEFDEKFDRVVLENPFSDTEELSNELLTLKKWAGLFLSAKIAQARAEAFAEVEKGLPKEESLPKTKCIDVENHLFSSCFQCEKIKGKNDYRTAVLAHLASLKNKPL